MSLILKFFNNLKSWFANIELKGISMFNRSYRTELFIVVDSIERLGKMAKMPKEKEAVSVLKKVIAGRMKQDGRTKRFNTFLKKKGIM